jgi:hypothetical protein
LGLGVLEDDPENAPGYGKLMHDPSMSASSLAPWARLKKHKQFRLPDSDVHPPRSAPRR